MLNVTKDIKLRRVIRRRYGSFTAKTTTREDRSASRSEEEADPTTIKIINHRS